jgi:hypothetical protein
MVADTPDSACNYDNDDNDYDFESEEEVDEDDNEENVYQTLCELLEEV